MLKTSYIIFYHRITPENLKIFEYQLNYFKLNKNIATIYEIENLKPGSIILTFDDGYFDNFVYAYPLLKKYNIPATIFISTAYITNSGIRNTLEDYWNNKIALNNLQQPTNEIFSINNKKEFLTWEEMRLMKKSGIISFESHGHYHVKHLISSAKKVSHYKGYRFFPDKKNIETSEQRKKRVLKDLQLSKNLIKINLGSLPEHLCWQWGEYDNFSIKIAKSAGFKYFYTTKKGIITNNFNEIPRISASFNRRTFHKRDKIFSNKIASSLYLLFFS